MQSDINLFSGIIVAALVIGAGALSALVWIGRRRLQRAEAEAAEHLAEAEQRAEAKKAEILVAAQEHALKMREELEQAESELDERESEIATRLAAVERGEGELASARKRLEREREKLEATQVAAERDRAAAGEARDAAEGELQRIAGLSPEQARGELIAKIEDEARREGSRIARKIEDEAREGAERAALNLVVQATERVSVKDVVESTVSFIQLPSDEMKGRIIGKEGRNIRALELATGIDLVVDDTPRSILISSFDPVRREVARVAIERLVEDGRIHPARIEEVVEKVTEEVDEMVEQRGMEAAYTLGISELNPKLARLVGAMRYHTTHGQNLLQHCLETAMIAGHLAEEVGASEATCLRAGLLHEVSQTADQMGGHPIEVAAELCEKYGESEAVVHAIKSLHPDVKPRSVEALLLRTAARLSDHRPGARKENLAIFIERLRRLEEIAVGFGGVRRAHAVKAGKELRVIVDTERTTDDNAYSLSKKIARAIEKEVNYPGQIKVQVIRETRSVRYAV